MTHETLEALVQVFTRAPVPGHVKTRLIPELGEEGAAELHSDLVSRILNELTHSGAAFELWCASDLDHPFFDGIKADRRQQQGDDLGARMSHALHHGLQRAQKVVLIGTDLPPLDQEYIAGAFEALATHDLVLGPALDGGYGLIGVSGHVPDIFTDISWGSSEVLSLTCEKLNRLRIPYALLPLLWDVDTPEDLPRYDKWLDNAKLNQTLRT